MTLTILFSLLLSTAHVSALPTLAATNLTGKAGIAGGGDAATDMVQFTATGKVSWYYTWSLSSVNTELEFVPMLWGAKDVAQWTDSSDGINATIAQRKPTAVLGMNEPQETGQSNLTPQEGADMWKTYIEPLHAQGLRLGSPAPSSAPSGKTWLQDFLTACDGGCTVDFIALHYYDVNATAFAAYLTDFHDTFQRPLWVTEWACQNFNNGPQCSAADVAEFLNQTQAFMDAQDWVERYAWYGVLRNLGGVNTADAMLTGDGKITDLGEQYIGAAVPKTSGAAPGATGSFGLPSLPTSSASGMVRMWLTSSLISLLSLACLM
ncbi:glycosyl hydrolase catalytic core-domain-containing protein [Mycena pura]|uniref:Glycosyl hydrolase catalytic core-domain-containing protein n=1 Tax=Mycena pura TaxID=153505 RepID=A0AAD6VRL6_9AGAR|nr:glycosyl hydrolase catalytic core-domain-containing protein [Mycena pura]